MNGYYLIVEKKLNMNMNIKWAIFFLQYFFYVIENVNRKKDWELIKW